MNQIKTNTQLAAHIESCKSAIDLMAEKYPQVVKDMRIIVKDVPTFCIKNLTEGWTYKEPDMFIPHMWSTTNYKGAIIDVQSVRMEPHTTTTYGLTELEGEAHG